MDITCVSCNQDVKRNDEFVWRCGHTYDYMCLACMQEHVNQRTAFTNVVRRINYARVKGYEPEWKRVKIRTQRRVKGEEDQGYVIVDDFIDAEFTVTREWIVPLGASGVFVMEG